MFLWTATIASLAGWIYLALFHGAFWKPLLDDEETPEPAAWPSVDIVVPARDEALVLPRTLPSLLSQKYEGDWRIMLVNDHSDDETGAIAKNIALRSEKQDRLAVLDAPDLPEGWNGKVAALQTAARRSEADYLLFTDADILHTQTSLRRLVARASFKRLDLVSRMVKLNARSLSEKLMIPAFVFFFALLYPFRRIADPRARVAGAAGGVMLVRRSALVESGGLEKIKNSLIDDCALASLLKKNGFRIELTLTRDSASLRPYAKMQDIHDMIARTAFVQLRHSYVLLAAATAGLLLLFAAPLAAMTAKDLRLAFLGNAVYLLMISLYWPMIRFYGLSFAWATSLPFAAIFYIVATLDSARRHALGRGGKWKGRFETL